MKSLQVHAVVTSLYSSIISCLVHCRLWYLPILVPEIQFSRTVTKIDLHSNSKSIGHKLFESLKILFLTVFGGAQH